jgi:hypothetical protein
VSDSLVFAVGVAVSPVPIASMTLILGGRRPALNASSFALGWIAGVATSAILFVVLIRGTGITDEDPLWISVSELVLGLAFLVAAAAIWRRRRRLDPIGTPAWLAALDRLKPTRTAALGAALSGANPKTLALALAAAIAITEADLSNAEAAATVLLFVTVGTAGVALPLAAYLLLPARSAQLLARLRAWLVRHDAPVLTILGVVIGAKFIYDALSALS